MKEEMVGSTGGGERCRDAAGMMALHDALRSVCLTSDWTYSVFWTIRPRPRVRGGNSYKVGDENGSLMLMWEDGYCRGRTESIYTEDIEGEEEDPIRKAFSKMSIQLYNYGEGLLGKVASDKCHKWVFREPTDPQPNISNYWPNSFDALPPEWTDQFESGIQTIAVLQAGHGLLQLGSCKIIPEDLHFVLRMRQTFESLGYQSVSYVSQLFSSNRIASTSTFTSMTTSRLPAIATLPVTHQSAFDWGSRLETPSLGPSSLSYPLAWVDGFPQHSDETHTFLQIPTENNVTGHGYDGISLLNATADGPDKDSKLLFNTSFGYQNRHYHHNHPGHQGKDHNAHPAEFLGLETQISEAGQFKRSLTLPARMGSSSSSSSASAAATTNEHVGNRKSGPGMYQDTHGDVS